eukprot:1052422-Amphidinium_carterae.1
MVCKDWAVHCHCCIQAVQRAKIQRRLQQRVRESEVVALKAPLGVGGSASTVSLDMDESDPSDAGDAKTAGGTLRA